MDNMNYFGQPIYGMGAAYNQPGYFSYGAPTPQNNPSLTAEEMKLIASQNPSRIDIAISETDKYRAICNHKDQNKIDRVVQLNDGSGDVFCPICNCRWSSENLSKEEVKELCDKLISAMQNAKWVGDYGVQLTREYFAMIPLLEKFPDLYEYAMKQFNKYCSTNGYTSANDAAIYSQYNNLMGFSSGYGYNPQPQVYYTNPGQGYYGAPAQQYGGYQGMPMNPYDPYAAQAPIQPTPGVGTPISNMAAPNYAPAAAQQPAGNTPVVTENANGTTTSESSVKLS